MRSQSDYVEILNAFIKNVKKGEEPKNYKVNLVDTVYGYFDALDSHAEIFDNSNGYTIASNRLNADYEPTDFESYNRSMPQLMDIGIMGHCSCAAVCKTGCYQKASCYGQNMSLETYKSIIDQIKDHAFEVALGGKGNCEDHEDFEEILKYTVDNKLVPNFTTSGITLNQEKVDIIKKYCGAVAVSYHPESDWNGKPADYTMKAISLLLANKVKTNIHFVLSKESIDLALEIISGKKPLPQGINAVIFLRYKPVGYGVKEKCLDADDPRLKEFFKYVDSPVVNWKIGFDSCTAPWIYKHCSNVDEASILPCEGCRWSMYASPDGKFLPCSFGNQEDGWFFDGSIADFWKSDIAVKFKSLKKCPWLGD